MICAVMGFEEAVTGHEDKNWRTSRAFSAVNPSFFNCLENRVPHRELNRKSLITFPSVVPANSAKQLSQFLVRSLKQYFLSDADATAWTKSEHVPAKAVRTRHDRVDNTRAHLPPCMFVALWYTLRNYFRYLRLLWSKWIISVGKRTRDIVVSESRWICTQQPPEADLLSRENCQVGFSALIQGRSVCNVQRVRHCHIQYRHAYMGKDRVRVYHEEISKLVDLSRDPEKNPRSSKLQ